MRYTFNPFTGQFDVVGSGSGSAQHDLLSATHPDTVVGDPVAGDLIYSNTTPAWTKLPVASVGESVLGVNSVLNAPVWRQLTTNDANIANWGSGGDVSLGLSFHTILTDFVALASPGIVVADTTISVTTRSIAVTDSSTIDFTVSNASGAAGNPTITGSVIPGGISHLALADLTTGDAGHTTLLLLAGRTGTTNNPILSSDADGTITGSAASSGDLYAVSTSHATKGALRWNDTQVWWEDIPDYNTGAGESRYLTRFDTTFTMAPNANVQHIWNGIRIAPTVTATPVGAADSVIYQVINHAATMTMAGNVALRCVVDQSTYINTAVQGFGGYILFQAAQTLQSNTAAVPPYLFETFVDAGASVFNSTGTATQGTGLSIAFNDRHAFNNNSSGTFDVVDHVSYRSAPRLIENAGTLTLGTLRRFHAVAYTVSAGTPAVDTDVALEIADLAVGTTTTALSLRSAGSGVEMRHAGSAVFGANAAPNNASTGLELSSTTKAFLPSRMTKAQRDALTGVNGMIVYNSTVDLHGVYQGGRWNELAGWNVVIVKSADQTVTNSTTFTDDTELQFAVIAGEVWHVELHLGMSANNTTGDGKIEFASSVATFSNGQWLGQYWNGAGAIVVTAAGTAFSSTTACFGAAATPCLNGDGNRFPLHFSMMFRASANATVKVQFANNAAAGGRTTTMEAGSMLHARRIS